MGREEGGGFRRGTHVHPWLIHVNVWQKPLQCCKVISLQLKKKKKKRNCLQCRRTEFDPWVRKNPWRREWLSPPVVLPGEFHGQKVNYNLLQKKKKKERNTHRESRGSQEC